MNVGSFIFGTRNGEPPHFKYAFTARIRQLMPEGLSFCSAIRRTKVFKSFSVGDSIPSFRRLCLYHSRVAGEALCRNCFSFRNCEKLIAPSTGGQIWRKCRFSLCLRWDDSHLP